MSVNDSDDHVRDEIEWHQGAARREQAVSGDLPRRSNAWPATSAPPSSFTPKARPRSVTIRSGSRRRAGSLMETWPQVVYQWHREGFALPVGAELLAEGDIFKVQAFRYGMAAYGIQFHARSDPRHDVPLDHARARTANHAGRQAPPASTSSIATGLRPRHPHLAQRLPGPLVRGGPRRGRSRVEAAP